MPTFAYQAIDASGQEVTGRIEAADDAAAMEQLRAQAYFVTRLTEDEPEPADKARPNRGPSGSKKSRQSKRKENGQPPRWFWVVWGSLFFLVGSVFLYVLTVRPLWGIIRAANWVETPCIVLSSELKVHDSSEDGPTYSIRIVYRYEFGGKDYESDRYDFVEMSSNTNVARRQRIVAEHRPGTETVCFVNPAKPEEAVLQRGWSSEMWWGLFPIPFVLIGLFGLRQAWRCRRGQGD